MFLGDVSTTSTNIYFVLWLLNAIIFSFQVHVTEFILFTLFFHDILPICTTGIVTNFCSNVLEVLSQTNYINNREFEGSTLKWEPTLPMAWQK